MRVGFCLLIVTFLSISRCKSDNPEIDGILIRIENSSSKTFSSVYVNSGGSENTYFNIAPGRTSKFLSYKTAYRYGYIKVITSGSDYVIQPFDYVGEIPLEDGEYTYVLGIESENLTFNFVEN